MPHSQGPDVRVRTVAAVIAATAALAVPAHAGAPAPAAPSPAGRVQPVIVVLRDQHPAAPPGTTFQPGTHRAAVLHADQGALVDQAEQAGATHVIRYGVINGFAATMTIAESRRLAADPRVAEVVPDLPIARPLQATPTSVTRPGTPVNKPNTCPADPKRPLTEPEALQVTNDIKAQQLATGKGVTVAFLADGIDTDNADFVRADGSHVFTDYRDFTGEGTNTPGDDREAFGDASAIAAQGRHSYDLSDFVSTSDPLPKHCDVRILGMAPGASLVGLKVIASNGFGSTSGVVQAIDHAVNVDHADVIDESLGANPYPDGNTDPFTLADNAAVAAGVTVVNSSGDAGYANTVDSPASDSAVISTGASTTYRIMAQTWNTLPGFSGKWTSDNVSAISSSGITQNGRVYDLVAPGDLGWALCSTDTSVHLGCVNYQNKPSPIQAFGGTSQAAPLTAGAAALVIQAYAGAHGGTKPTPAMVKQILTSTATDEYDPAERQGAGLLNALAAVQAAVSVGTSSPRGDGLLFGRSQLDATGDPGSTQTFDLPVTNIGSAAQTVTAHGRSLSRTLTDQQGSILLDTTAPPTMTSRAGAAADGVVKKFGVPPGADHLDASIAWSAPNKAAVILVLLDPTGAFAGYSMPQSSTGPDHGHVDVHSPMAGTWTALIYSAHSAGGFAGQVGYEFTTTKYTGFGTVTGELHLAPGATGTLHVTATTPANPGDAAAAVEVDTPTRRFAVPVVLRSLVPTDDGRFAGVLTGGNGRGGAPAQTNTFAFDVPPGRHDIGVSVTLHGSLNQAVLGYLVSPDGQVVSQATNVLSVDDSGAPTEFGGSLQGYRRDPLPGRWHYVVVFANPVGGAATREPFTGRLSFDQVDVGAANVPSGAVLPAGKPATITVDVHNTGAATGSYYVDARLATWGDVQLVPNSSAANVPLSPSASLGYVVPTDTSQVTGITAGTIPLTADLAPNTGEPERLAAPGPGDTAVVAVRSPVISQGLWLLEADPIGPFGTATTGTANFTLIAHTQDFDDAVTSSTGDHWLSAVRAQPPAFAPLSVDPGRHGTITVTVRPDAPRGTHVSGYLYVDQATMSDDAGDELKAIPYSYTVG